MPPASITATTPGFHTGRPPRNKDRRYPADPPKVEEIVAVMRQAGTTPHGLRMRGLIVGIDSAEIIDTVHARRAPVVPVSSTLRPCPQLALVVKGGSRPITARATRQVRRGF
jgi:hypothetical protein